MQRLRSEGAIQTAKRSVTRVIDQADEITNQLDPDARLEKRTLAYRPELDLQLPLCLKASTTIWKARIFCRRLG